MKVNVYSIYDKVAGIYSMPIVQHNDNSARRYFQSVANASLEVAATDCQLYKIGEYDTDTGIFVGFEKPDFLCNGEVIDK